MSKPLIQIGTEVREMTNAEFAQYETDQAAEAARVIAEAEAKAAEETAKQQAFNDAVAAAVAANTTTYLTPDQIIYNGEVIAGSSSVTTTDFHIAGYEIY